MPPPRRQCFVASALEGWGARKERGGWANLSNLQSGTPRALCGRCMHPHRRRGILHALRPVLL